MKPLNNGTDFLTTHLMTVAQREMELLTQVLRLTLIGPEKNGIVIPGSATNSDSSASPVFFKSKLKSALKTNLVATNYNVTRFTEQYVVEICYPK